MKRFTVKLKIRLIFLKDSDSTEDIFDIPLPIIKTNYDKLSKFVMELPQYIVDLTENIKGFIIVIDNAQHLRYIESAESFFS